MESLEMEHMRQQSALAMRVSFVAASINQEAGGAFGAEPTSCMTAGLSGSMITYMF